VRVSDFRDRFLLECDFVGGGEDEGEVLVEPSVKHSVVMFYG